jgi:hypothetical protein
MRETKTLENLLCMVAPSSFSNRFIFAPLFKIVELSKTLAALSQKFSNLVD